MHGVGLHLGDISLLLVTVVKSCPLSTGHGQFVLVGDITIDALVLETILAKLVGASVLTSLSCLLVHLLAHANQGRFEFIQGNASILIQIELRHEHLDLVFERREAVGLSQEFLNLMGVIVPLPSLSTRRKVDSNSSSEKTLMPKALTRLDWNELGGPSDVIPKKLIFISALIFLN